MSMIQSSDRLQGEGKPIPGNTNQLLGKTGPVSGRIETEPGRTEPSLDKERSVLGNTNLLPGSVDQLLGKEDSGTEPGFDKVELGPGCEVGLREELELTSVERFKKESVTKKNEVG
jgi:hypothetical protein